MEPFMENYAFSEQEKQQSLQFSSELNSFIDKLSRCTKPIIIKQNRILKVLEYIQLHYRDAIVLTEVAEHVGMSASALSKLVTRFLNLTFTDLITKVRVAHAVEMIRTTDQPLGLIAYDCGFSTYRTFIRSFCQTVGMIPSEFRKVCNLLAEEEVAKVF